jgi:predicted Rossmann-fold nucleotide-binding protein
LLPPSDDGEFDPTVSAIYNEVQQSSRSHRKGRDKKSSTMIDELIRWSAGPSVRGGGSVGLMGLISRAVHNGGGHMLGVTVLRLELIGDMLGELETVSNMHHSKAEMAR